MKIQLIFVLALCVTLHTNGHPLRMWIWEKTKNQQTQNEFNNNLNEIFIDLTLSLKKFTLNIKMDENKKLEEKRRQKIKMFLARMRSNVLEDFYPGYFYY